MSSFPNTPVATSKTAALSRILDSVPKGYVFWMAGQIPKEKMERLARKFHERYGIGCSPAQRITRKQQGQANALLVLYCPPDCTSVEWLLLATQGNGMQSETLRRIDEKPRLVWLGYELLRYATRQKTSWTWRRTKAEMAEWYALLESQLKPNQMFKVEYTLVRIAYQPGFHGVREQSFALCQFAQAHGYRGEIPHLFYLEKVSHGERILL